MKSHHYIAIIKWVHLIEVLYFGDDLWHSLMAIVVDDELKYELSSIILAYYSHYYDVP